MGEVGAGTFLQGAPPCKRRYPFVQSQKCFQMGYLVDGHHQEEGLFWTVLDPHCNTDPFRHRLQRQKELRWVESYELFAYCDGGREWTSFGEFKGNTDTITEKAHSLCAADIIAQPDDQWPLVLWHPGWLWTTKTVLLCLNMLRGNAPRCCRLTGFLVVHAMNVVRRCKVFNTRRCRLGCVT